MRNLVLLFIFALVVSASYGQGIKFNKAYGNNGFDYGRNVVQGPDNLYYIVGSTSSSNSGNTDILVFCLDENGNELWTKFYGSPQIEIGSDIAFTASGDLMILGYTNGFGAGGFDIYLIKINTSGDLLEEYTFGGDDWDFAYDMEVNPTGGFYIVGETYSEGAGNNDGYLLAIDDSGNLMMEQTYGTIGVELFRNMTIDDNGDILTIGDQKLTNETNSSSWVTKISSEGDVLDEYTQHLYPDVDENGQDIFATSDEIIVLSTFTDNPEELNKSARWSLDYSFSNIWSRESSSFILTGIVPRSELDFFGIGSDVNEDAFSFSFSTELGLQSGAAGNSTPTSFDISFGPEKFYNGIKTSDHGYLFIGEADINNEGQLSVLVTKFDSLLVAPSDIEIAELPLSISEYSAGVDLKVYPSPVDHILWISNQDIRGKVEYQIINAVGQVISSNRYDENGIDVSDLSNGLYFLELTLDTQFYGGTRFIVD